MNILRLSHFFSNSSRLFLKMSDKLSATFLVIWLDIFFTLASLCKYERLTFNGMSGESITPCNKVKNSGTMPSTESVTNT